MKKLSIEIGFAWVVAMCLSGCASTASDGPAKVTAPVRAQAPSFYPPAPVPAAIMPPPMVSQKLVLPEESPQYRHYGDNPVQQVSAHPLTTFSLDMDTGSYANVRRFLNRGELPPVDGIRVEELINYFPSDETPEKRLGRSPFAVDYELAPSPWNHDKTLLRVNVQAMNETKTSMPPSNLVFLVDVSGSMDPPERLPLIKSSLKLLTQQLRPQDAVSLVTYASGTEVVLPPTSAANRDIIDAAIDRLVAGGTTAGASGLQLAYKMARQGFIANGVNRVLLATDGDFNVGVTSTQALVDMIKHERDSGVTLSTLGVGDSDYKDAMMVQIADAGNGNYSYIDTLSEADKVLRDEMRSTLVTVAKDVKAQIEFNPSEVLEYRQIGYEKRQLNNEDFNNDQVDAGDIGAGKRVTVLYELTLKGQKPSVDQSRYQAVKEDSNPTSIPKFSELAFIKLRWKAPGGKISELASTPIGKSALRSSFDSASSETRFLAAVAAYGQKLRGNPALASTTWPAIAAWANDAKGRDNFGYRAEFVRLVRLAGSLSKDEQAAR
ncbi:hypothetical protein NOV72_04801 [Caballeronia novacaledonica]|uniref:VWFA domain-containing protein n=1 Tax=Caballeronia novacaledonica TaxID=1544861 RepID=A0A2U3IBL3_9BURK|nr:VWA domain-containing protein [Caballeronia novacaledonica]SPB17596.1 hypothetical protein NOV72_04801 [Caballeronia novacaledonica]